MAINLPGPYEVDYSYVVGGLTHHTRFNCIAVGSPVPGSPIAGIDFATKSGGSIDAQTAIDDVWDILRSAFNTGVTAGEVTLWKYQTGTYVKDFVTSTVVANPAGSTGGAYTPAHQLVATMRTANGSFMKLTLLETSFTGNDSVPYVASVSNVYNTWALYALSADGWMIGRDDSFPIATLKVSQSQNEKLFRTRYRT